MPKYLNVSATQRVDYIIEATFNHTWRLAKFITRIPHKLASTHKIHTHSHTHLCKHTHMRSTYICLAIGQDNCWRFAGRIYFLACFLYLDIRCSHSSPLHSTHPTLLLGNCTRAQSVTYAHECEHDICWFRIHTHTHVRAHPLTHGNIHFVCQPLPNDCNNVTHVPWIPFKMGYVCQVVVLQEYVFYNISLQYCSTVTCNSIDSM